MTATYHETIIIIIIISKHGCKEAQFILTTVNNGAHVMLKSWLMSTKIPEYGLKVHKLTTMLKLSRSGSSKTPSVPQKEKKPQDINIINEKTHSAELRHTFPSYCFAGGQCIVFTWLLH